MGFVKTLARAVVLWGKENAFDVISTVEMPEINEQSDCRSSGVLIRHVCRPRLRRPCPLAGRK